MVQEIVSINFQFNLEKPIKKIKIIWATNCNPYICGKSHAPLGLKESLRGEKKNIYCKGLKESFERSIIIKV